MGGLVVKQTYILARADPRYQPIVPNIYGMIFLATPHRGSDYGSTLSKIIAASPFHSEKKFVEDLKRNSYALQAINEQFRHHVNDLKIASFIESLGTPIFGGRSITIVNKDSGTLGYPEELVVPVNEDHHTVCKYSSQNSPTYQVVLQTIKEFVEACDPTQAIQEQAIVVAARTKDEELIIARELLYVAGKGIDGDFIWYRSRRLNGTCNWILQRDYFQQWRDSSISPSILWLNGSPAFGKSVLTATVTDHLLSENKPCVFFFFRHGDRSKQNQDSLIRSFAYQLAMIYPAARDYLCTLHRQKYEFKDSRGFFLWYKVLLPLISALKLTSPIFWVIDALDEADEPEELLAWMKAIPPDTPIKIFISSRVTSPITVAFNRLNVKHHVHSHSITEIDTLPDIRKYVDRELADVPANDTLKEKITQQVMDKCAGSFLWVKLVISEVNDGGHTEADISMALNRFPIGMEAIYQRGLGELGYLSPKNIRLAKVILTWILCAIRPLTLQELQDVLSPEFGQFFSLPKTIQQICGQFLLVDGEQRVQFIHKTARDFLISSTDPEFLFIPGTDHEQLALACINCISSSMKILAPRLRSGTTVRTATETSIPSFFDYAVLAWPEHLQQTTPMSELLLQTASEFMDKYFLAWGSHMAMNGDIVCLAKAGKSLRNCHENILLKDKGCSTLGRWARDIERLIPEFGGNILLRPASLLDSVPSLCPSGSLIYSQPNSLYILGAQHPTWNDFITHVHVGLELQGTCSSIACSSNLLAVGLDDTIFYWETFSFQKISEIKLDKAVTSITFNNNGTKLLILLNDSSMIITDLSSRNSMGVQKIQPISEGETSPEVMCINSDASASVVSGMNLHTISTIEGKGGNKPTTLLSCNGNLMDPSIFSEIITIFNHDSSRILKTCNAEYMFALWESKTGYLIDSPSNTWFLPLKGQQKHPTHLLIASAVAFNPKSHLIYAYCKETRVLLVWDHRLKEGIQSIVEKHFANLVCSPNGEILAGVLDDGQIDLLKADTLNKFRAIMCPQKIIKNICFSADSTRLIALHENSFSVYSMDESVDQLPSNDNTIENSYRLLDLQQQNNFNGETGNIFGYDDTTAFACSPDGKFIASGSYIDYSYSKAPFLSIHQTDTGTPYRLYQALGTRPDASFDLGHVVSITVSSGMAYIACTISSHDPASYVDALFSVHFSKNLAVGLPAITLRRKAITSKARKSPGQILISQDERFLLHTDGDAILITSIADGTVVRKTSIQEAQTLCKGGDDLWKEFPQVMHIRDITGFNTTENPHQRFRTGTFISENMRYIVSTTKATTSNTFTLRVTINSTAESSFPLSETITIPDVYTILGFHNSRLAFLSTNLWISSLDLPKLEASGGIYEGCYRHFFLPQSWLAEQMSRSSLGLCMVTPGDGAFVYVRNSSLKEGGHKGPVIIKGGLDIGKWEAAKATGV
ncbi:hypothetical protein DFH27DRAFT_161354 [Peziza echinospora]|nr:hypothetical protein DFH27DRAFT_161354 [Peziza echinospora]